MSLGRFNTLRGFWPRARNTWICMTSQPVLRSLLCPGAIQGRSSSLGRGLVDPMWIAIQPSIVTGMQFHERKLQEGPTLSERWELCRCGGGSTMWGTILAGTLQVEKSQFARAG